MECLGTVDDGVFELYGMRSEGISELSFGMKLDYIPFVSSVSGIARGIFGILEVIFGALVLPVEAFRNIYTGVSHEFTLIRGALDILRGYVAFHPFVGNISLYLFDHSTLFNKN